MRDQPIETNEAAAEPVAADEVRVLAPANRDPNSVNILLTFFTLTDGYSIDLATEDGSDVDPRNPMHALALYVQHNPVAILPHAAMWLAELAKQNKLQRAEAAKKTVAANDSGVILKDNGGPVVAAPAIVDAGGQPLVAPVEAPSDLLSPDPTAVVERLDADPNAAQRALEG